MQKRLKRFLNVLILAVFMIPGYAFAQQAGEGPAGKVEVAGKDVFWLRRYPKSIRTAYDDTPGGGFILTYEIEEKCLNCVIDYYRTELPSWSWSLIDETSQQPDLAIKRLLENVPGLREDLGEDVAQQAIKEEQARSATYMLSFKKEKSRCIILINQMQGWVSVTAQYIP